MEGLEPVAAARLALGNEATVILAGNAGNHRWPGSYALLIKLDLDMHLRFAGRRAPLPAGWYAYAGSARGPGGVGARIARHMAANKKPHWHVDALTLAANKIEALALRDVSECEIAARLSGNGFVYIQPGFGSSDCWACASHLLAWQG